MTLTDTPGATPPPIYKDRKAWLVVFGILTLLGGLCLGLFGVGILVASRLPANHLDPSRPPINMAPFSLLYFGPAAVLIWLGIGSIMARRWARALLAVWSWSWFAIGLVAVTGAAFFLPRFMAGFATPLPGRAPMPEGTRIAMMTTIFIFYGLFLICLPLIWGLFYSGKNVKATCEARDPVMRWTDRCPLPVLAASLWLTSGVLFGVMLAFHPFAFFFGIFLSGAAAIIFYLIVAVIWLYAAWALYRLELRGWWIALIGSVLFWLSTTITYARHDFAELYAKMGYTPAQLESLHFMNTLQRGPMVWWTLLLPLPFLAYLIWLRKFFRQPATVS